MPNKKKRMKHRATAQWLRQQQVCPECGEKGLHWVSTGVSLQEMLDTGDYSERGFWTCAKFYKDGVRIDPVPEPNLGAALGGVGLLMDLVRKKKEQVTEQLAGNDYVNLWATHPSPHAFFDPNALQRAMDASVPEGKIRVGGQLFDVPATDEKIPTGLQMPEGGLKRGELFSFLGRLPRRPGGYKSDLAGYFFRQALVAAKTPEERQKLTDQYLESHKLNIDLESTPEIDKRITDSYIQTLQQGGFFDKKEVLPVDSLPDSVDHSTAFQREMDEELNPPKITLVEKIVQPELSQRSVSGGVYERPTDHFPHEGGERPNHPLDEFINPTKDKEE